MSEITVIGRISTEEIKPKANSTGQMIVEFIVTEFYGKDKKSFFSCEAWEGIAEFIANNSFKGQEVFIKGQMVQKRWEDKEGNRKEKWVLIVDFFKPFEKLAK